MVPDFRLIMEAPEDAFLGCRMATREDIIAREFEAKRKLELGDIMVNKSFKDGQPHFAVYARMVRMIDCSKDESWLDQVEECLKTNRGFEVLNATPAHIAELGRAVGPYADWWQWSDKIEPTPRRSFRPIPIVNRM
jgi:hypothetical protein